MLTEEPALPVQAGPLRHLHTCQAAVRELDSYFGGQARSRLKHFRLSMNRADGAQLQLWLSGTCHIKW